MIYTLLLQDDRVIGTGFYDNTLPEQKHLRTSEDVYHKVTLALETHFVHMTKRMLVATPKHFDTTALRKLANKFIDDLRTIEYKTAIILLTSDNINSLLVAKCLNKSATVSCKHEHLRTVTIPKDTVTNTLEKLSTTIHDVITVTADIESAFEQTNIIETLTDIGIAIPEDIHDKRSTEVICTLY